jgi:hypothetical protein
MREMNWRLAWPANRALQARGNQTDRSQDTENRTTVRLWFAPGKRPEISDHAIGLQMLQTASLPMSAFFLHTKRIRSVNQIKFLAQKSHAKPCAAYFFCFFEI